MLFFSSLKIVSEGVFRLAFLLLLQQGKRRNAQFTQSKNGKTAQF
jgi:hypothetical protein